MTIGRRRGISMGLARTVIVTAVVGLLGQVVAQSAWRSVYSEPFGEDAHPLYVFGGVIRFGPQTDSPFVARMTGGVLELSNDADSTTSRYYFVEPRSEEHTSELQSRENIVCRLLLDKKNRTDLPILQHCVM